MKARRMKNRKAAPRRRAKARSRRLRVPMAGDEARPVTDEQRTARETSNE